MSTSAARAQAGPAELLSVGPHKYRFEKPDLFLTEMNGDLSAEQQGKLYDVAREYSATLGKRVYWISDVRNAGKMSPDARRLAANTNLGVFLRLIVLFGASLHVRVVVNLVMKASALLQSHRNVTPAHFVATEADAREYIEAHRRETEA